MTANSPVQMLVEPKLLLDANRNPIPVLGHVHGDGVPSSSHRLDTIAANAQKTFELAKNSIYEISVYDNADPADGDAENVLIKPGISGVTIASLAFATTDAYLVPTSKVPTFQVQMKEGQTHLAIGTLSTVSTKTLLIFARRLR